VHALHDVGDALVVEVEEARDAPPVGDAEREGLDVVETHAHADVPTDHVGDQHRALHHRPDRVAFVDVFPEARLGTAAGVRGVLGVELRDLLGGPVRGFDGVVLLLLPCLLAFGADHQPVLPRQDGTFVVAEHVRRPLVHCPTRERRRLVEHGDHRVATPHPPIGTQRRPPFPPRRGVERVHAPQRVTLHQVALVVGDRGDLVLTDQAVAPTSGGGANGPPHTLFAAWPGSAHNGLSSP
jgi:hypothetical protein